MIIINSRTIHIILLLALLPGWSGQAGNAENSESEHPAAVEHIGVLRSTDHGATWSFHGYAEFNAPTLIPVDPSPLAVTGGIALYFLDLATLGKPPDIPRVIYRATTSDGLLFSPPAPAFSYTDDMTDPYVLRMPDLSYRMYVQAKGVGIISASSSDGLVFTQDSGVRSANGGIPGALVTPEQEIRLFLCGEWEGEKGIYSALSSNGLDFTNEGGLRILTGADKLAADPHPIRLQGGGYLMSFIRVPPSGVPPLDNEIRLAASAVGFNWSENPDFFFLGANPGLVETADGTMYIYFVDFRADWSRIYLPITLRDTGP